MFSLSNTFSQRIDDLIVSSDTQRKELRASFGVGIANYDKSGFLYSFELQARVSTNLYIGVVFDNYDLIKSGNSAKTFRSLSGNLLYNWKIANNKVDLFLGGGALILVKPEGFGLNGYAGMDYNFTNSFSTGLVYKQPLFIGTDYAAPPLMLFNFKISYKLN